MHFQLHLSAGKMNLVLKCNWDNYSRNYNEKRATSRMDEITIASISRILLRIYIVIFL
jgi:hypothetical protein